MDNKELSDDDKTKSNGHESNGHANGQNGKLSKLLHEWNLKSKDDEKSGESIVRPSSQLDLAQALPGNDDMVITSRGKVVPKSQLEGLRIGGKEGNKSKTGQGLPDLEQALVRVLSEEKNGRQALDAILEAMRSKATRGGERAAELLLTRAYGAAMLRLGDEAFIPVEPITGFTIDIAQEKTIDIDEATTPTE